MYLEAGNHLCCSDCGPPVGLSGCTSLFPGLIRHHNNDDDDDDDGGGGILHTDTGLVDELQQLQMVG